MDFNDVRNFMDTIIFYGHCIGFILLIPVIISTVLLNISSLKLKDSVEEALESIRGIFLIFSIFFLGVSYYLLLNWVDTIGAVVFVLGIAVLAIPIIIIAAIVSFIRKIFVKNKDTDNV